MLEFRDVDSVRSTLQSIGDHSIYVVQKSDSCLNYFVAGFIAKSSAKRLCNKCIYALASKKFEDIVTPNSKCS